MTTYRQIRPSWALSPTPTPREETTLQITPAAAAPAVPAVSETPSAQAAGTSTGTDAIYLQVIASLQKQITALLTLYAEPCYAPVPPAAPAIPSPPSVASPREFYDPYTSYYPEASGVNPYMV